MELTSHKILNATHRLAVAQENSKCT